MNSEFNLTQQCASKTSTTCELCGYESGRASNLKRHRKTMHEEAKTDLSCCDIRFINKAEFREHCRKLHRNGHECSICHRNFSRRALLRRHQSVHTGYKEFRCNQCSYASSHKSNLERHYKTHAPSNPTNRCMTRKCQPKYPDPDSTTCTLQSNHNDQSKFSENILSSSDSRSPSPRPPPVKLSHSIESILGNKPVASPPKVHLTIQGSELDFLKPDYSSPTSQHIINHSFTQTINSEGHAQSQDLRWIYNPYQSGEIYNNMFSPNYIYNYNYSSSYYSPFQPRMTPQGSFSLFYTCFPYNNTSAPYL